MIKLLLVVVLLFATTSGFSQTVEFSATLQAYPKESGF